MGLFKHFSNKPTKQELNAFKHRLKIGDDPNMHWQKQKELWEEYKFHKETAMELLRKYYNVTEHSSTDNYSQLAIWIWSSSNPCDESPIGEHLYMHHFGDLNPKKGQTPVCLACKKELKL